MDSLLSAAAENQLLAVLATLSFLLLVVVTGGVVYLTSIEWRNKRQRIEEAKVMPLGGSKARRR